MASERPRAATVGSMDEAPSAAAKPPARDQRWQSRVWSAGSFVLLLAVWEGLSRLIGSSVLPGPWASIAGIADAHRGGYLWSDIAITSWRVLGAFLISLTVSIIAGALLGWSRIAERLFGPWITITASIPALVFIVVIYLAIGLTDLAAMVGAAFVVVPLMTYTVWDGMRAINPELEEMARAFGVPKFVVVRRVLLPQTAPFVFTAARSGLSLTWRIMVFVELVGRSSGVGYRIQYWYNLFDMTHVIAAALPFILLMLGLEYLVLRPVERWVFRWRKEELR
jgi:NitT/TauT family transport system permease protein